MISTKQECASSLKTHLHTHTTQANRLRFQMSWAKFRYILLYLRLQINSLENMKREDPNCSFTNGKSPSNGTNIQCVIHRNLQQSFSQSSIYC